jgi:hypothetical protein
MNTPEEIAELTERLARIRKLCDDLGIADDHRALRTQMKVIWTPPTEH